jgi:hypothetical protein
VRTHAELRRRRDELANVVPHALLHAQNIEAARSVCKILLQAVNEPGDDGVGPFQHATKVKVGPLRKHALELRE